MAAIAASDTRSPAFEPVCRCAAYPATDSAPSGIRKGLSDSKRAANQRCGDSKGTGANQTQRPSERESHHSENAVADTTSTVWRLATTTRSRDTLINTW